MQELERFCPVDHEPVRLQRSAKAGGRERRFVLSDVAHALDEPEVSLGPDLGIAHVRL